MSERPFMQLYVSDFVGDTLLLSTEHIGAYLLLLIALWNADGVLPNDDVKLARVARMGIKRWHTAAREIMPFFEVKGDTISHHRLSRELQKSERTSESRAAAGSKGGTANALKYNTGHEAIAPAGLKHARASPEPYRKKGAKNDLEDKGSPPVGVQLDRYAQEVLFKACEALTGETIPTYIQYKTFPASVVEKASQQVMPA